MDMEERYQRLATVNKRHAKADRKVTATSFGLFLVSMVAMYLVDWSFWFSLGISALVAILTYFALAMVIDARQERQTHEINTEYRQIPNPGI